MGDGPPILNDADFLNVSIQLMHAAASICSPLWWKSRNDDGHWDVHNGTAFFLRTEAALFGVTAAHVLEGQSGWRWHQKNRECTPLRLTGSRSTTLELDWNVRAVDANLDIDIATFMITEAEISTIGQNIFTSTKEPWPQKNGEWVSYCGFPGKGVRTTAPAERTFGAAVATGKVASVNDRDVHVQLERQDLVPVMGRGLPPTDFDFGGISGGPLIRNFLTSEKEPFRVLGGVIRQGRGAPDELGQFIPGFELITARRADFLNDDGTLDHAAWANLP